MGATEEQMQLLNDAGITHVSYVLILYSVAFILFLCKSISIPCNQLIANFQSRQRVAAYLRRPRLAQR